jgi:hypothetical protein
MKTGLGARFRTASLRDERGVVAVEAAFVFPVLLVMALGLVELGLIFQDAMNLTSVTRSAARLASTEPRLSGANPHQYADDAAASAAASLANVPVNETQELWVYKADSNGLPIDNKTGSAHGFNLDCVTCWIYAWQPSSRSFTLTNRAGGWPATGVGGQDACAADPPDSLGIYVKLQHRMVTGAFGTTTILTDSTVIKLEPVPGSAGCKG